MTNTKTAVFLFLALISDLASAETVCNRVDRSRDRIDVTIGSNTIVLQGWEHGFVDQEPIDKYTAAIAAGNCQQAYVLGNKAYRANRDRITNVRNAITSLRQVNQDVPISFVGSERPQEFMAARIQKFPEQRELPNTLKKTCNDNRTMLLIARSVMVGTVGPELYFVNSLPNSVPAIGMEDGVINAAAQIHGQEFKEMERSRFAEASQPFIKKMTEDSAAGRVVSLEDIEAAAKADPSPLNGEKVRQLYLKYRTIQLDALVRNEKIADNLLAQKKSGVMLVGSFHLTDLADKLIKKCQASQPSAQPAAAPVEAPPSSASAR